MKTPLFALDVLDDITIAAPCPAAWDKMKGNGQVRFCGQCRQNVYNLSEMSAAAAVALIERKRADFVFGSIGAPDGTVITADCPVGLRWRIWQWLRQRRAWAAALFAILFLPACGMGMPRRPGGPINMYPPPADQVDRKDPAPIEQNKGADINPGVKKTD